MVFVDLSKGMSAKNRSKMGADLIITYDRAFAAGEMNGIIEDTPRVRTMSKETKAEERKRKAQIRENMAEAIAQVIEYKKSPNSMGYRRESVRKAISDLLRREEAENVTQETR